MNFLNHLARIHLSILKKLLQRTRLESASDISILLPELRMSYQVLLSRKKEDGSWHEDPNLTAMALCAALSYSEVTNTILKAKTRLQNTVLYLKKVYKQIIRNSLKRKDLYSGLDRITIAFGNITYALRIFSDVQKTKPFLLSQSAQSAFLRLIEEVAKYCSSLDNLEVVLSILQNFSLVTLPINPQDSSVKTLLKYVINQCIEIPLNPQTPLAILVLHRLIESQFKETLHEVWFDQTRKRSDKWREMSLEDGLSRLITETKDSIVYNDRFLDDLFLLNSLLMISEVDPKDIKIQRNLLDRILTQIYGVALQNTEGEIRITPPDIHTYELSQVISALSKSIFAKIAAFPASTRHFIRKAITRYTQQKEGETILLTSSQYTIILVIMLGSILLCALFALWLYPQYQSFVALTAGAVITFLVWILPRPKWAQSRIKSHETDREAR